jgi:hypothetical protein
MKKLLIRAALAAVALVIAWIAVAAASGRGRAIPLWGGFVSRASIAEVQAMIPAGLVVTTIEDSKLPDGDPRPAFAVLKQSVAAWRHDGFPGDLGLEFWNGLLHRVEFRPADPAAYFAKHPVVEVRSSWWPWCVRCQGLGYPDQGRAWAFWTDAALEDQMRAWISKYS